MAELGGELLEHLPPVEERLVPGCSSELLGAYFDYVLSLDLVAESLGWGEVSRVLERAEAVAVRFELGQERALCVYTRAEWLRAEGRYDEALAILEPVLDDLDSAGYYAASCALLASKLAAYLGSFGAALKHVTRALQHGPAAYHEELGDFDVRRLGSMLGQRGEIFLHLGLAERAMEAFDREEELAEASGNEAVRRWSLLHRCDFDLELQRHRSLERRVRAELARSDPPTGSERAALEIRLAIALADLEYSDADRAREARALFESLLAGQHLGPLERLRCHTWLLELDIRSGRLEAARERLGVIEGTLGRPDDEGSSPALLELRDLAHGLAGRLALSDPSASDEELADGRRALLAVFEQMLDEWRRTDLRAGGVGFLVRRPRRLLLSQVIQFDLRLGPPDEAETIALGRLHQAQAMGSHARERGYEPLELAKVQAALCGEAVGLLVYMPSDVRGHLFCVDRDVVRHFELPAAHEWQSARDAFVDSLRSGTGDRPSATAEVARLGREVGSALLPPAAREHLAERGWRHATVVGAELLGYAPFEYFAGDDATWLHEELDLSYLPSIPFGMFLANRAEPARRLEAKDLVLVVANRAREPHFPFDHLQRDRLTEPFGGDSFTVHSGSDATLAALEERLGLGDRVAHLVAHGELRDDELRPVVVLAGDRPLSPDVLHTWSGAPDLAFLSVCRAAHGAPRKGDDVPIDLGSAYLAAGSRAVVLPRLPVDYAAQVELARAFYDRLTEGEPPARALSAARSALAASERFAHPAHGLMHVVGLGDRPVFDDGR